MGGVRAIYMTRTICTNLTACINPVTKQASQIKDSSKTRYLGTSNSSSKRHP